MVVALALAACETQPPAPVEFGHRADLPRAVAPGRNAAASDIAVAPGTTPEAVTVQAGDTVYALSRRYHRPVRAIIDDNNLQPPYQLQPGQRIALPGGQFHTVQRGETLYSISRAYGVDLYSIARTNDLEPPYTIAVGQQLRISAPGGSAIATAPHAEAVALGSNRGIEVEALPPPGAAAVAPPASTAVATAPAGQAEKPALPQVLMPPPPGGTPATQAPAATEAPAAAAKAAAEPAPEEKPAMPESKPAPEPQQQVATVPPRAGRTFSWPVRGRIISGFGPKADGLHNDGINISARAGAPVIAAENGVVVYAGNELRGFGNLLLIRHAGGWITAYAHLDKMLVKKGQQVSRGQAIGTVGSTGGVSSPQLHFEIRQGTQAVDPAKFLSVA